MEVDNPYRDPTHPSEIVKVTESVKSVRLINGDTNTEICDNNSCTGRGEADGVYANPSDAQSKCVLREAMLNHVAGSDAHFKHQQQGEPDLSQEEKYKIVSDVLDKNPVTFLFRFGRHLLENHLCYFSDISEEYEVRFYLADIRKFLDDKKNDMKKRNRRFEAMKKMMTEEDYFSADSMKERDPLLYQQLIGQYLTDDEVNGEARGRDLSMSALMMQHVQAIANTELYNKLCDLEDGQMEEEEEDSNHGDEELHDDEAEQSCDTASATISPLEKQMLKNEFLRTMQLRFLNGEDQHFNYKEVDENVEYDSLDIREHDEEEKYFDQSDNESTRSSEAKSNELQRTIDGLGRNVVETDEEADYDQYVVVKDVCPGLNADQRRERASDNTQKEDDIVEEEEDEGDDVMEYRSHGNRTDCLSGVDSCKWQEDSSTRPSKWGEL